MMAAQEIVPIEVGEVVAKAEQAKKDGYRLVQVGCTKIGDDFEIIYVYDKDFALRNYRITVKQDTAIPSISGPYFGAFLYENEIHDLFGIAFDGLVLDFKGALYQTVRPFPFAAPANTGISTNLVQSPV